MFAQERRKKVEEDINWCGEMIEFMRDVAKLVMIPKYRELFSDLIYIEGASSNNFSYGS